MRTVAAELGSDALVEDFFGLNLRGLATIRDAILSPKRVAKAARSPDWQGRYSPTVRVVFFLLTLSSILRFFWADADGIFARTMETQLAAGDAALSPEERNEAISAYFAAYAAALPFAFLAAQVLAAWLLRLWGEGFVIRLRLHMLAVIPSTVLGLVLLVVPDLFLGESQSTRFLLFTAISSVSIMLVDGIAAGRILPASSRIERLGKASLFALVVQLIGIAFSAAASAAASFFTL